MQYDPKKGWEYDSHPNCHLVNSTCNLIIASKLIESCQQDSYLEDTRPAHGEIFAPVTPEGHPYFAGNYRGAPHLLLQHYNVEIGGYLGVSPSHVAAHMSQFGQKLKEHIEDFKELIRGGDSESSGQKLLMYCQLLAFFFVRFLAIHPYANGNGHMARLLVWVLLKKEGIESNFWSVGERPGTPKGVPLDACIQSFREGDYEPLIKYFMIGIYTQTDVTKESLGIA